LLREAGAQTFAAAVIPARFLRPTIQSVDPKERSIRNLYDARARRDWQGVRDLLADDVGWYEPSGEADHAGTHRGADTVVALLQKLVAVTDGTFQLTPAAFLNAVDYSVCIARWSAERGGTKIHGDDLAVYRFERGKIADVWFYDDGYDPEVFKGSSPSRRRSDPVDQHEAFDFSLLEVETRPDAVSGRCPEL